MASAKDRKEELEDRIMSELYEALADLLEYPGNDWNPKVGLRRLSLKGQRPGISFAFAEFRRKTEGFTVADLQELYTRTFDLNPVCALEVGYHLFGENYKRGIFLANLRETETPFALGQERQLPDYLPVLLRLLGKLDDEELRGSLITECLLPAIEKMLVTFGQSENPYRELIQTVGIALKLEIDAGMDHCCEVAAVT